MKKLVFVGLSMLWCGAALAGTGGNGPNDVPEIDAIAGLAALGLVGAAVSYVWERQRRKSR